MNGENGLKKKTGIRPSGKIKRNHSKKKNGIHGKSEHEHEMDLSDLMIQMEDDSTAGVFHDSYSTFQSGESFN